MISLKAKGMPCSRLTSDHSDTIIVEELCGQHVGLGHVLLLGPKLPSRRDRPVTSLIGVHDPEGQNMLG
jgi:hypothetical protein